MPKTKVFCVGELLIDFVAENQGNDLTKANIFSKKAGGAPANVSCAIAKLGGKSAFIGCVGNDPFGEFLLETIKQEGVDISMVQRSDTFTTLAFVSIADDGERDFVFSRGADIELKYDRAVKKEMTRNIVHFGAATALLGGSLEETYSHFLFDSLCCDVFVSFDPNYRGDLWKNNEAAFIKKCLPYIEKSHLCKFSLEEAQLISGEKSIEKACDYLHNLGSKIITITLGSKGTFVSTEKQKQTVPSITVNPVDTTGAGDAFIGCLLFQISKLDSPLQILNDFEQLLEMVQIANKAGAITTTNFGAIVALPTLKALEKV